MNKPITELKNRLKIALEIRNISQQELADMTKIPKASISQYLSGYTKPKQDRIYSISKALHINEAWLLGYDVSMDSADLDITVHTIAAHHDDYDFTEEELDEIEEFKKYVLSKRKK